MRETIMILALGEILFDLFPGTKQIGGAPFNFAFHLKKLGFPIRFVSRLGQDENGSEIRGFLKKHRFDPEDIQTDRDHDTGTVEVTLAGTGHEFKIIPDTAWDHLCLDDHLSGLLGHPPDLLYFGTLVQRSEQGRQLIQAVMRQKSPRTKVFCDINLRPGFYSEPVIQSSLAAADILKLSNEELAVISPLENRNASVEDRICQMMADYDIAHVILTMGVHGSQWFTQKDQHVCPPFPVKHIVDTVGAGDAYAAVSAAGWLTGLPIDRITDLAGEFASYVCSIKGALPEDDITYMKIKQKIQNP